eukprot:symbB.v1.2.031475.t1/scaffold3658.1/size52500/6
MNDVEAGPEWRFIHGKKLEQLCAEASRPFGREVHSKTRRYHHFSWSLRSSPKKLERVLKDEEGVNLWRTLSSKSLGRWNAFGSGGAS